MPVVISGRGAQNLGMDDRDPTDLAQEFHAPAPTSSMVGEMKGRAASRAPASFLDERMFKEPPPPWTDNHDSIDPSLEPPKLMQGPPEGVSHEDWADMYRQTYDHLKKTHSGMDHMQLMDLADEYARKAYQGQKINRAPVAP